MWFEFMDKFRKRETPPPGETLLLGARRVSLLVVRNPRARRYLLRLRPDGTPRVTIPRGGSAAAAREFVERNRSWLERQWQLMQARPRHPAAWQIGSNVLFRGELAPLQSDSSRVVRLGSEVLRVANEATNLRPAIERHLHQLAAR